MKTKFIDHNITYDGSQLRSLYAFLEHHVQGDSIVSWVGPCDIPKDKIVDGQDLMENSIIYSEQMLHFIIEIFDAKLIQMVLIQRLFCELVKDSVFGLSQSQTIQNNKILDKLDQLHSKQNAINLIRSGDDLYLKNAEASNKIHGKQTETVLEIGDVANSHDFKIIKDHDLKFNISIATVSPVSGLVHFGINVSSKNTPVKTFSLLDLQDQFNMEFSISDWAKGLMSRFSKEWESCQNATKKVKWVK